MSLWNTLVVSFLQTFWNKNVKASPLSMKPLSPFKLHWLSSSVFLSYVEWFCYHQYAPKSLNFPPLVFACDGFVADLVCVSVLGSFLIPSVWRTVWPLWGTAPITVAKDVGLVGGWLERVKHDSACFTLVWFGEGPNYMNVLKWNLLVADFLFYCTTIFWRFCTV